MKFLAPTIFLTCLQLQAATVQFTWTNFDATVSTNDLVITQVNPPINDGTFTIKGLPRRYPTTNGFLSATLLTGNYSVLPYGANFQPVLFAVPNDSQTYDYWQLRISGGNTYNYSPGVQQLIAGSGTSLSPSNGKGVVTVTSTGSGGIGAVAAGSGVTVSTNSNLYTVSLPFTPQIASSTLSNYSTVGTNYWYPTNNPQGFITTNNVPAILGYVTNVVTTNTSAGVTNKIQQIIGLASINDLADVTITTPANGQILAYNNGWVNQANPSVTSIGVATPAEFSVSGSPVTSSGTITISKANQNANLVYAGPTTGGAAAPTFRALVAADIPSVSSTVYASNILSGGNVAQLVLASNSPANGWFLANSNGFNFWTINGGAATNLQSANLIGTVPTANLGSGTANSSKFLRGDQTWANTLLGNFTISSGNLTVSGTSSLDNGAITSDGSGNLTALKHIGRHAGSGDLLTNLPATNIIGVLPDARISNNIPRLEAVNTFANNNLFSGNVEFDGGIVVAGSSPTSFGGPVRIGSTGISLSNRFEVINAQGRFVLEVNTNGPMWVGTNHQFKIDYDGSIYSDGASNHLNHQLVCDSQITGNTVYSPTFIGNGGAGLTNVALNLDANQFNQTGFNFLHLISGATATNLSLWGDSTLANNASGARIALNNYFISNDFANSFLTIAKGSTFLEQMDSATSSHKFSGVSIVGTATSNNFSGLVKAATLSGIHTNTASSGGKVQVTDANGKIVDVSSGAVPIDGDGTATTSAQVNTLFPGNIVTNGDSFATTVSNTWTFKDAANNQASITNGVFVGTVTAATITNRASSGNTLAAYDANGKLVNVTTISGGSFSGNTLTVSGAAGTDSTAWHQSGDNSGTILGNTNSASLQIRGAIPAGGQSVTFVDFEATSTPAVNIYGGLTNGCISATTFHSLVWGGQHNTINTAGTTADSIVGGQFNFVDSGGASPYGATILGGASNHVAGTGAYAMGVGARAINDYSFVWCGLPNRIITTSGGGGDNGKTLWGISNAGFSITNGNDATICGKFDMFGMAAVSTNSVEANSGTFGWTNGTGGFSLLWSTTNSPYAGHDLKIVNGSLGGSNAVVFGTQVKPQAFQIKTNGDVRIEGSLVVLGSTTTSGAGLTAGSVAYTALAVATATNIASHFADAGNSGTADTTLFSDSIPASTLGSNGYKLRAKYGLNTVAHATATRQIKVFFAGTSILDTTALATPTTADNVDIEVFIIRDSSTTIRYDCRASMAGGTATNFVSVGKLTGLTLSGANTLELHGQAGAAGAASNDIVATLGTVNFEP